MADANATAAARAVLGDLGLGDEGAETPSGAEEVVVETDVQQETAKPEPPDPEDSFAIPPDIQELLEEPDFEAETEAELAAESAVEEDDEFTEYDDDAAAKERKLRIAAEKKAKWLEEQRLRDKRPEWKREALKYFPHSKPFIDKIVNDAGSRRAVLRQANAYHEQIAAHVSTHNVDADGLEAKIAAKLRAEMEQAWGKPLTGPNATQVPAEARDAQQNWEAARARGDQLGMTKARLGGAQGIKNLLGL
jgi:hypothetical protein